MYPDNLRYTAEHEWVEVTASGTFRVGITDYAQDSLGDIVYVSTPAVDESVTAGSQCGEVESTKSVSDIFAPVSGTISARNDALDANPELINADPYGAGWMIEISPADPTSFEALLTAAAYQALVESGA
jgi:glycine cleavage system H protein